MNPSIKNITQQVDSHLDSYATEFHGLVNAYAQAGVSHGKHSCEFFIDPASFIEGYWAITPHNEEKSLPEFKEFNWLETLDLQNASEIEEAFKAGYTWLITQLGIAKKRLTSIELKLYHSGSMQYEDI